MSGQTEIIWGVEVTDTTLVTQDGADNWKEVTLADVVSKLGDGLHGTPEYDEQGNYPFINGNNLLNGKIVIKETTLWANEEEYKKHKKELNERTILVSINGTLGNVALYNNEKCILGKSACYFNVLPEVDRLFIKYVVTDKTFQDHIKNFAHGTTIQNVSLRTMREYPFLLPTLPEQKAIVGVLSSLDDKIDLLHRQNATLEALAETLFRQWFVEEAKEEWVVGKLSDVISVKGGTTPSTKEADLWDGEVCWTTPRDLSNHISVFLFDTERKITSKGLAKIGSGLLPVGTVLLSSRAPIGYLAITNISLAINQGYIAILCNKVVSNYFMYLWCKSNLEEIKSQGNGSVFQEISKSTFKEMRFTIPPKPLVDDFDVLIDSYFEKIRINQTQIRTLYTLRNTLLPKLMSGEVRVSFGNGKA